MDYYTSIVNCAPEHPSVRFRQLGLGKHSCRVTAAGKWVSAMVRRLMEFLLSIQSTHISPTMCQRSLEPILLLRDHFHLSDNLQMQRLPFNRRLHPSRRTTKAPTPRAPAPAPAWSPRTNRLRGVEDRNIPEKIRG